MKIIIKMTQFFLSVHQEKNWVILTLEVESLVEPKFHPTFYIKMTNFFSLSAPREKTESYWLKKLSNSGN